MKVLIAGGTGFLGKYVVEEMNQAEVEFTILSRKNLETTYPVLTSDIFDLTAADLKGFDQVIHMAGLTPAKRPTDAQYFRQNQEATKHLVCIAEEADIKRFIYISTTSVYSKSKSAYTQSKQLAEEAVNSSALNWIVLRPSYIFGLDGGFWEGLFSSLGVTKKRLFLKGSSQVLFHPVYCRDVARSIVSAICKTDLPCKTFNISGEKPISYGQFYRLFRQASGKSFMIISLRKWLLKFTAFMDPSLKPDNVANESYDHSEARELLSYQPTSYLKAFDEIVEQLKKDAL